MRYTRHRLKPSHFDSDRHYLVRVRVWYVVLFCCSVANRRRKGWNLGAIICKARTFRGGACLFVPSWKKVYEKTTFWIDLKRPKTFKKEFQNKIASEGFFFFFAIFLKFIPFKLLANRLGMVVSGVELYKKMIGTKLSWGGRRKNICRKFKPVRKGHLGTAVSQWEHGTETFWCIFVIPVPKIPLPESFGPCWQVGHIARGRGYFSVMHVFWRSREAVTRRHEWTRKFWRRIRNIHPKITLPWNFQRDRSYFRGRGYFRTIPAFLPCRQYRYR